MFLYSGGYVVGCLDGTEYAVAYRAVMTTVFGVEEALSHKAQMQSFSREYRVVGRRPERFAMFDPVVEKGGAECVPPCFAIITGAQVGIRFSVYR